MPNDTRITALPPEQLVTILRSAGSRSITIESVREDIAAGAPVNDDGTMSLVEYGAWLAKETDSDNGT